MTKINGDYDANPRWEHQQHYDKAMEALSIDEPGVATAHALLGIYRLLQQSALWSQRS